jgi:hypothetical protein
MPLKDGEFSSQSHPSRVTWSLDKLQPPSNIYITRDDQLFLQLIGAANDTVQITARILTIDLNVVTIQRVLTVNGADTLTSDTVVLAEGFLLSVSACSTVGGTSAPTFLRVMLFRGPRTQANVTQVLLAGNVGTAMELSWPVMEPVSAQQSATIVRVISVSNPAAGAQISTAVPTFHRWQVRSIVARLTASAVVGNRRPQFQFKDGSGNVFCETAGNVSVTAGQVADFVLSGISLVGVLDGTAPLLNSAPIPDLLPMTSGFVFSSTSAVFDAGDTWTNVRMLVEDTYDNV